MIMIDSYFLFILYYRTPENAVKGYLEKKTFDEICSFMQITIRFLVI